jgi:medium-chain acyl-[acyl-carrier-protein] hydrolase
MSFEKTLEKVFENDTEKIGVFMSNSQEMKQQVWSESYKITSYLVNLRNRAGLFGILNIIQDVGWQHAIHLEIKMGENLGWVFTRQKLVMNDWPAFNETVTVRTWLRPPASGEAFLYRDYELFVKERKIGECTSTFTVINTQIRKLAVQDWSPYPHIWRRDHNLNHKPEKIVVNTEVEDLDHFQVRNSDIDLNIHVNNTKYAQWILDALPMETLRSDIQLHSYEVNFLAETKIGDTIGVQKSITETIESPFSVIYFQGVRDGNRKPVFTAKMKILHSNKS